MMNKRSELILQITDLHLLPEKGGTLLGVDTDYYLKCVLEEAFQRYEQFDLILVSGDLAQEPCVKSYQRLYPILAAYQTKTICLPGNHDDYALMRQYLNKGGVSCNKLTPLQDWLLISLSSQKINSAGGRFSPQELKLLKRTLTETQYLYIMIAIHHHCVPSGSQWMDTMLIENRAEFFECLNSRVKIIVTGHIHQEMNVNQHERTILSSPSTCFQFKPQCKKFTLDTLSAGYRVIQLFNDGSFKTQVHYLAEKLKQLKSVHQGY